MAKPITIDLDLLQRTAYYCERYMEDRWKEMLPGIRSEGIDNVPFNDLAHDVQQRAREDIEHIAAIRIIRGMVRARSVAAE